MAQGASALEERNGATRSTIEGEGPAGWLDEVRGVVDAHLARFFDARRALASELVGGDDSLLIDALAELTAAYDEAKEALLALRGESAAG